jgi:N-acetylglutamate synthase-like GNAT family acetyltransferase
MNRAQDNATLPYQLRRATLEDLPELILLWQAAHLEKDELSKRLTEFQIARTPDGKLAGAVGLQIQKLHGLIHSEAFVRTELGGQIRPLLWQRVLAVAKNNGLTRLWTLPTASFYREQGMTEVDDPTRKSIPEGFGSPLADWVTLKLKEENQNVISLEKEFEMFTQAQKGSTERLMEQARFFRVFAYGLLACALIGLGFALFFVFRRSPIRPIGGAGKEGPP